MTTLQALIPLAFTVSLAAVIVGVGLDAELDDLICLFRRPAWLAKAVLSVNVVVPAAAILIVFAFPLTPVARAGVLVMAVSPVPPLVASQGLKAGASKASSYGLYGALALLSVVIVPLTVALYSRAFGRDIVLQPWSVAENVALTVIAPLAFGLALRRWAPRLARRVAPVLKILATGLLLLALAPLVAALWPAMVALAGNGTLAAMALVSAIALAAGHLLGGPDPRDRAALAYASATRHPGVALLIAGANSSDTRVTAAILAVMLVGMVVTLPYELWLKRRASAAPRETPDSARRAGGT